MSDRPPGPGRIVSAPLSCLPFGISVEGSNWSTVVQCPAHIFISLSISGAGFDESVCAAARPATDNERNSERIVFMSDHRNRGFARWIKEGQGNDFGGDGFALGFDGHFDVESGAEGRVIAANAGEGDHFFERRRPR